MKFPNSNRDWRKFIFSRAIRRARVEYKLFMGRGVFFSVKELLFRFGYSRVAFFLHLRISLWYWGELSGRFLSPFRGRPHLVSRSILDGYYFPFLRSLVRRGMAIIPVFVWEFWFFIRRGLKKQVWWMRLLATCLRSNVSFSRFYFNYLVARDGRSSLSHQASMFTRFDSGVDLQIRRYDYQMYLKLVFFRLSLIKIGIVVMFMVNYLIEEASSYRVWLWLALAIFFGWVRPPDLPTFLNFRRGSAFAFEMIVLVSFWIKGWFHWEKIVQDWRGRRY